MTTYIQVDDPAVIVFDPETPDDTPTHYSVGTLREFARQQQSRGAAKLRSAMYKKLSKIGPDALAVSTQTLIDARTP